jgi:hypothetical protein
MERKASRSEPLIKKIISGTFPEYKGRKIRVSTNFPLSLESYWSDGTKSSYVFYQPDTDISFGVDSLSAPWKQNNREFDSKAMPSSVVLVEHKYFCGVDMGIFIYVRENEIKMLEKE